MPSLTLKEKQKAYWNAHFEAIRLLGSIGIVCNPRQRLSPFYLRNKVVKNFKDKPDDVRKELVKTLDILVLMRKAGAEPQHSKGMYT